jgi:hypothetical protein
MNNLAAYLAQAGVAAGIFIAAGLLGRFLWEQAKGGR